MNLLPPDIIRQRKLYTHCIRLAVIQAVIFLLLILSVWALTLTIGLRETYAIALSMQLQDERFVKSEALVLALREHSAIEAAQQTITDWLALPVFNAERLEMIQETLPAGVQLFNVDIDSHEATLTFYTEDLSLVDLHRDAWISTGLASRVQLVSASVADGGRVQYILSLHWINEY